MQSFAGDVRKHIFSVDFESAHSLLYFLIQAKLHESI